ncbi:hypothetical protein [Methylobacterium indicum]|uniref:hypothetical protein n=1 Tax=Methylobacterium indicum TaxID=1775910 RepID=UPI002435FB15|nr:hypothetical protein [Methylobacterium indicum]
MPRHRFGLDLDACLLDGTDRLVLADRAAALDEARRIAQARHECADSGVAVGGRRARGRVWRRPHHAADRRRPPRKTGATRHPKSN